MTSNSETFVRNCPLYLCLNKLYLFFFQVEMKICVIGTMVAVLTCVWCHL